MENKIFNSLSENKNIFDQYPSNELWSQIDSNIKKVNKPKTIKLRYVLSIAACLVVLIIAQINFTKNHEGLDFYGNFEVITFENIESASNNSNNTVVSFNKINNIYERYSQIN